MEKKQKLKKVHEAVHDSDQPHRILSEMGLPEGTEFTTDDSEGMVKITVGKIKYGDDY
jgi:hypothetical protein